MMPKGSTDLGLIRTTKSVAFIDLGPKRVQYFCAVSDHFAPDWKSVHFSLRCKSRSLLRKLGRTVYPPRRHGKALDLSQSPPLDSVALISKLRTDRDRGEVRQETSYYRWLVAELQTFLDLAQPSGVFLWNGSGLAAAIAEQLALSRGVPLIFGENGYLPGTLQLDPVGVNAFASFGCRWSLEQIRGMQWSDREREELRRMLADYRANRLPRPLGPPSGRVRPSLMAYLCQSIEDLRHRQPSSAGNRLIARQIPELPPRFLFFPLQVKQDSQLTVHSPLYGNRLEEAILDLRAALPYVGPDMRLVVKLHPADLTKSDYDPMVRACPDVIWVAGGDVRHILERSELVVTVNSTVGIEALMFGKPVVVIGNSPYGHPGLVHPVSDRTSLVAGLRSALSWSPDETLVEQYLMFLYFRAFTRGHWRDYSPESLKRVARCIVSMAHQR